MNKPWWLPEGWHAETWVCSMQGHVVVDGDGDDLVSNGDLARCLRCDAWVPRSSVDSGAKPVPWPRRGKELHQAIVLRLIAMDRAFHALVLIPVGLILGWLWLRLDVLSSEAQNLAEGLAQVSKEVGHLGSQLNSVATRVAALDQEHVRNVAMLVLAYGIVEGVEAVGLWLEKRWAEYLTVVVTAMDAIAAEAGVSKASVYRWWSSKEDLIVDAVGHMRRDPPPSPCSDDPRADLIATARDGLRRFQSSEGRGKLFPRLLDASVDNPAVAEAWRRRLIMPDGGGHDCFR